MLFRSGVRPTTDRVDAFRGLREDGYGPNLLDPRWQEVLSRRVQLGCHLRRLAKQRAFFTNQTQFEEEESGARMPNSSRHPLVVLEHTAQSRVADDLFVSSRRIVVIRPNTQERLVILPLMRAFLIVISNVLAHDVIELPQTEHNEPAQALVPKQADPAFSDSALVER